MILAIFDRDGTIIENDDFPGREKNWESEINLKTEVVSLLKKISSNNSKIVVVSNQAGVARNYFPIETVNELNNFIQDKLSKEGIQIDSWQFCPDVDKKYADSKDFDFNPEYVKIKTDRKPATTMVEEALKELKKNLNDFDTVFMVGNAEDDELLAKNLSCPYIDVNNKSESQLIEEFDSIVSLSKS